MRVLAHERARQRDLLPLAAGQVDAGVEPLAERGVVALGKAGDQLVGAGLLARADDRLAVGDLWHVAEPDVLRGRRLVVDVVLEHRADLRAQLVGIEVADVDAVDQDPALDRVVEAADELEQRRLAGAVAADDRQGLPRLDREARRRSAPGSRRPGRRSVTFSNVISPRSGSGTGRRARARTGIDGSLGHQLEEVVQVEVVLVHAREAAEDALDRVLHRHARPACRAVRCAQRQPAGDRLQRDVEIGDRGRRSC